MKLLIGENIRRLRRERDLTQEEVAAHLGISFQSISKWERGDGYPDITILPSLANYFGITVDELIGMEEHAKSQKFDEINRLWKENNLKGLHQENVVLMRNSLKMFPNNDLLLVQLSTSLEKLGETMEKEHSIGEGHSMEKAKYLRESIAVQEQILRFGKDSEVRSAILFNICFSYWKCGEREKALERARQLPNLYKARENALVYFLQGDEKHAVAKEALTPLAWSMARHLSALAETEGDLKYLKKALQILDILFEGKENETITQIRSEINKHIVKFK